MSNLFRPILQPVLRPLTVAILDWINAPFNLFAAIINDAGELAPYVTFTRPSTATRYNSAGLLETVAANAPRYDYDPTTVTRANLLTYSEDFSNAVWVKSGATVSANDALSPIGTSDADKIVESALNEGHNVRASASLAGATTYAYSFFVKQAGRNSISVSRFNSAAVPSFSHTFDLSSVTSSGGSISDIGSGWYRCSGTFTTTGAGVGGFVINMSNGASTVYAGDGTSGIYLWGAQLETGSTATDYIPTGVVQRGPELVANGDFSQGSTGWLLDNASLVISGGAVSSTADTSKTVYQTENRIVAGRTYEVIYTASGLTVNGIRINVRTPADNIQTAYNNTNGTVTTIFTASVSGAFGLFCFASGVTIDNISVREINADYNSPRGNATLRGLLIEEQRTNLLVRSQEIDNASWVKTRTTVTANAATAPDGTLSADKLIEDTNSLGHVLVQQITSVVSTVYTFSVYLKAGERTMAQVQITNSAGTTQFNVQVNLANGTFVAQPGGAPTSTAASVTNVGNGFYRVAVTMAAPTTATQGIVWIRDASGATGYTGNGTSGIFVWGAQLEAGAFATSYIPTTTAAVTRATDFASVDNLAAIGFNASTGTFLNEFRTPWAGGSDPTRFLLLFNSDPNKRIMYFNGGMDLVGTYDGTTIIYSTGDATGVQSKVASAYSPTDRAICNSGGAVNTGAIAAGYTTATSVSFGGTQNLCGHIRRLRYYNRRLPNATLQALTAP